RAGRPGPGPGVVGGHAEGLKALPQRGKDVGGYGEGVMGMLAIGGSGASVLGAQPNCEVRELDADSGAAGLDPAAEHLAVKAGGRGQVPSREIRAAEGDRWRTVSFLISLVNGWVCHAA